MIDVLDYLKTISFRAQGKKGIIFLQLDSRGSNYVYPHIHKLAQGLIDEGYCVVSVTKGGPLGNPCYVELDIRQLAIHETWYLLALLKAQHKMYVIAVNSVFWAASAGLGLPNLGLQHWIDKKGKEHTWDAESYTRHNKKIIDYKPDWIIKWFKETFKKC